MSDDAIIYWDKLIQTVQTLAEEYGSKSDVRWLVIFLLAKAHWRNGVTTFDKLRQHPISNAELARWAGCGKTRLKEIRQDPLFRTFFDIEEGFRGNTLPKYTTSTERIGRVYSRLQEQLKVGEDGRHAANLEVGRHATDPIEDGRHATEVGRHATHSY